MFYENWFSYLKDGVKLKDAVIPGSHNAGTYKMIPFAKCQSGSLYEQYKFGVRYFDTRFHMGLNGKAVFEHGIISGSPFEEGLADIRRMLQNNDSEFMIFALHYPKEEYLIGKIGRKYKRDFDYINDLFEKYIEPSKYALTDFDDISKLTLGDIRNSGKRYLLAFDDIGISRAVGGAVFAPWRSDWHGMKIHKFFDATLKFFEDAPENALFCYQTQRTPGVDTEEGLKNPITLERNVKMNFYRLTERIANENGLLSKVNIISGDFMTDSHTKINHILKLNLIKNNVKPEFEKLFYENVKV